MFTLNGCNGGGKKGNKKIKSLKFCRKKKIKHDLIFPRVTKRKKLNIILSKKQLKIKQTLKNQQFISNFVSRFYSKNNWHFHSN